jgi:hypothetical protein
VVTTTQLAALGFAILVVVVVSIFLKQTATGTAMRAIANNRDVSSLLGVPIRRIEALAWLGSGVICGCVFLLLPPLFKSIDQGTLTWFIIGALGGGIVGQFRSLWIPFFASLTIGVIESILTPPQLAPVHVRLPQDDAVHRGGRCHHVDQPSTNRRIVWKGDAMTAVATPAVTSAEAPPQRAIARVTKSRWFSPAAAVAVFAFAVFFIPAYFDSFWVANFTQMAVFSILAASAGLLYGATRGPGGTTPRMSPYGIGCWVTIRPPSPRHCCSPSSSSSVALLRCSSACSSVCLPFGSAGCI